MPKKLTPEEIEARAKAKRDAAVERQRLREADRLSQQLNKDQDRANKTADFERREAIKTANKKKQLDDEVAHLRTSSEIKFSTLRRGLDAQNEHDAIKSIRKRLDLQKKGTREIGGLQRKNFKEASSDLAKLGKDNLKFYQQLRRIYSQDWKKPRAEPTNFKAGAAKAFKEAYVKSRELKPADPADGSNLGLPPIANFLPQAPAFTIPKQSLFTRFRNFANAHSPTLPFLGKVNLFPNQGVVRTPPTPPTPPNNTGQQNTLLAKAKKTKSVVGSIAKTAAGLGILGSVLALVQKTFMATWNYIDEKVLPTQSMLNRSLGATTPGMKALRGEAMSTALQFERLGLGFEKGAETVNDLAVNMRTAQIPKDALDALVKVSEYVGLGGEGAGKLGRSFMSTGVLMKDLGTTIDDVMISAGDAANQFNVPMAEVQKSFGDTNLVQRWGTANYRAMALASAKAISYNLSLEQIESTFGKNLDTFENSSDVAAKLNAAFGTSIDSMKLLGMNASQRMDYLREQVRGVGVDVDNALPPVKNLLMSITGAKDYDEVASIFGSQKQRDEFQKQKNAAAETAKGIDAWRNALGSLGKQLVSIEQLSRNFFMAVGNIIARLLGFKSGMDGTTKGVKTFETFVTNLTVQLNKFAQTIPADGTNRFLKFFDDIGRSAKTLRDLVYDIADGVEDMTPKGLMSNGFHATKLAKQYENIVDDNSPEANAKLADLNEEMFASPISFSKAARRSGETEAQVLARVQKGRLNTNALNMYTRPDYVAPPPPAPAEVNVNVYVGGSQVEAQVSSEMGRKGMRKTPRRAQGAWRGH